MYPEYAGFKQKNLRIPLDGRYTRNIDIKRSFNVKEKGGELLALAVNRL